MTRDLFVRAKYLFPEHRERRAGSLPVLACLLASCGLPAFAQNQPAARPGRPLALNEARYRLRAGERARVDASPETLDILHTARTSTVTINGSQTRGFAVGPSMSGDDIVLAASLTMKPGEYAVTVSAIDQSGEQRTAAADITVEALPVVPPGGSTPPVVLLNGWQFSVFPPSSCPISPLGSAGTFGSLASQLVAAQVYFFDNCVEQSVNGSTIEALGVTLGQFLNMVQYAGGALVPQVDLVSHSMGGLIARSYLAGLQANGSLSPPLNPRVRKFIEIATPNFGSFLAANYSDLLANGTQAAEMVPGSSFLWSLGTWNQHGDDLRGVDALAIIGNAGYWKSSIFDLTPLNNLTDGVVSLTSASHNFARDPSRTRILAYCHIDSPSGATIDCIGKGIANVDADADGKRPKRGRLFSPSWLAHRIGSPSALRTRRNSAEATSRWRTRPERSTRRSAAYRWGRCLLRAVGRIRFSITNSSAERALFRRQARRTRRAPAGRSR